MLRRIANSQSKLLLSYKPVARISELKEYACLIESFDEQAAQKAIQDYQALAKKYNIGTKDLIDVFKLVNSEPELLKHYISHGSWLQEYENQVYAYRMSSFYDSKKNLLTAVQELKRKYPEAVTFDADHPERARAHKNVENIFLKDGPTLKNTSDNKSVEGFIREIEKRINGHVNELRQTHGTKNIKKQAQEAHDSTLRPQEPDAVDEIERALKEVLFKLQVEPAYAYGKIQHFIAVHQNQKAKGQELKRIDSESGKVSQLGRRSRDESSLTQTQEERGELTGTIEEGNDIPLIIEDYNKELQKTIGYNFLPWVNDRKLVYEAEVERANPYLFGVFGGLLGAYFLYKIYQGDATYTQLLLAGAASYYCLRRYNFGVLRNQFDYLVQMNIHRDGRHLDLFIKKPNNSITRVEGVPTSDFKVHRSDYTFQVKGEELQGVQAFEQTFNQKAQVGFTISDLRKFGIGEGAWVATYGQDTVLVPMSYKGNGSVISKLFRGKNVELLN